MAREKRLVKYPLLGIDAAGAIVPVFEGMLLDIISEPTTTGLMEALLEGRLVQVFESDVLERTDPL